MTGKTKEERRRQVELLLLAGRSIPEIAQAVKAHEETVARDIKWLEKQWAKRPEAKGAYERRIATLKAMSQFALEKSQSEKSPNTALGWFQAYGKMSDELAKLSGVGEFAESAILIPEALRDQDIDHVQVAYRGFWIGAYALHELRKEILERELLSHEEVKEIIEKGKAIARDKCEFAGPWLDVVLGE